MSYTFEEFVKYKLDGEQQKLMEIYVDEMEFLKFTNETLEREAESNNEQLDSARDLVGEIISLCELYTKDDKLTKSILLLYENSYFEI